MDSTVGDAIDEVGAEDIGDRPAQTDDAADINRSGTMTDNELKTIPKDLQTNVTVVEYGDTDDNIVSRTHEEGTKGAKSVAANTDVQRLVEVGADTKILMGEQKTQDRGAGSLP